MYFLLLLMSCLKTVDFLRYKKGFHENGKEMKSPGAFSYGGSQHNFPSRFMASDLVG